MAKSLSIAAAFILSGSAAFGAGVSFLYEQDLEGVYSQSWSTAHLGRFQGNTHEIYVKGEGKLGDFYGVLYLNCDQPKFSKWYASGGYLTPDNVPPQAIAAIKTKYC